MMSVATAAALASGAAMGLLNLIMGNFLTTISDYTSGASNNDEFLRGVRKYS